MLTINSSLGLDWIGLGSWGVLTSPMGMLDRSLLAVRGVAALPRVRAIVVAVWRQF